MIVLCNSVIAFENDALKIWWVRVTLYWHSLPPIPHSLSLPLLYKAIIDHHIFSLDDATEPFGEQAEVTMRTNFWGTLWVCHALLPLLRPNARVVNVSSFVSKKALDTCSPQLQAKYDLHSVSKTSFILNLILNCNRLREKYTLISLYIPPAADLTFLKEIPFHPFNSSCRISRNEDHVLKASTAKLEN